MEGNELRLLRKHLGLTQAQLAQSVDVPRSTLGRWEREEVRIPKGVVERLFENVAKEPTEFATSQPSGVVRDPHHRAILAALQGQLDRDAFESCAVDLLSSIGWPVVLVPGGSDDGFDGAVTYGDREPFPLVVTTGQDLLRNLKGSLKQVREKGWNVDSAIFATSRQINGKMRRKLRDAAKEAGFTLVQAYGRHWFADRLYEDPTWCRRLLGVTGRPRALSVFPKTRRPVLGGKVLGREADMSWLANTLQDCLIVGSPGSGKTFMLRSYAKKGSALFLVDSNREQIANDLRELKPSAVIIDDSHIQLDLIDEFRQIRQEVGAESIRIIGTCWPGYEETVRSALQITDGAVRTLDLLDADTIIEIIKSVGVQGPRELLAFVRRLAGGRPGLAATLAHLCLTGNINQVTNGEAVLEQLMLGLDRIIDLDAKRLLAPFALGGDTGFSHEEVGRYLGISRFEISEHTARLSAAGIIRERRDEALSVEPPPVRWVLVRDTFFKGAQSLPYAPLLEMAGNWDDAIGTLIGARSRGADIPNLLDLVEQSPTPYLLSEYALLGQSEAQKVISRHPEMVPIIAKSILESAPNVVIPILLDEAARWTLPKHHPLESPMESLKKWATHTSRDMLSAAEVLHRRTMLIHETERWWQRTKGHKVATRSLCVALNPRIDYSVLDPGRGRTLTHYRGMHSAPILESLTEFWPSLMNIVHETANLPWENLFTLISDWCYEEPEITLPEAIQTVMREFSRRMLRELIGATRGSPGVQHRLGKLAAMLDVDVEPTLDELFEACYPDRDDFGVDESTRLANVLARRLMNLSSHELVETLQWIGDECRIAGLCPSSPTLTWACNYIAAEVNDPFAIANALIDQGVASDVVKPFVSNAAASNDPNYSDLLQRCLKDARYESIALNIAIRHPNLPRDLLREVIARTGKISGELHFMCARGDIPDSTLAELLRTSDDSVAISAATGHWFSEPKGCVKRIDGNTWRSAILRSTVADFNNSNLTAEWLGLILSTDSELARDWFISEIDEKRHWYLGRSERRVRDIIRAMTIEHRWDALNSLPQDPSWGLKEIAAHLIGGNLELYRRLMDSGCHDVFKLAPLAGRPDKLWAEKALIALDAGYSIDDIVSATTTLRQSWRGEESEMWAGWIIAFKSLRKMPLQDPRMLELVTRGIEITLHSKHEALERERTRAVYGDV